MNNTNKAELLSVNVDIPSEKIVLGDPFLIRVSLQNKSQAPLLINKRLGVGYRQRDSRELFLEIRNTKSNLLISTPSEDYERGTTGKEDYIWLNPGESIHKEFDLFEWYELELDNNASEEYFLTVYYQADESYEDDVPENIVKGVFSSSAIKIMSDH